MAASLLERLQTAPEDEMMAVSRVAEVLAQSETLEDLKLMHRDGLAYADHLKRYQGAHHAYHKALHSEQQWAAVPGLQGEPCAEAGSRQGREPLHADRAPHACPCVQ